MRTLQFKRTWLTHVWTGCAAFAASGFLLASPVHAQAAADIINDDQPMTDPEIGSAIVVTAQRRSESLMDVPVAITAFTGETLAKTGVVDIQTMQMATPSLVFNNTGAYAQPFIRGVGSRLLQNGFDPSVATYMDGRYLSRQSAISVDLFDTQRVEVLKGPQGVLFGRNASAGAIRVITNEVSDYNEGAFKVGYGNYDAVTAQAMGNVRLSDSLGFRLAAMSSVRDGIAKNIDPRGRRDWDDKNLQAVRGKLRFENGTTDANLTLSYWRQKDNSGNETVALGPLDLHLGIARGGETGVGYMEVASQFRQPIEKEEFAAELDLSFDLGAATLSTVSTYADLDNVLSFDGDGTSAVLVDAYIPEKSETLSQEIQLSSNSDGPFEWIGGVYYYNDDTVYNIIIDQGSRVISQGVQAVETESYAAFGQVGYDITENLKLIVGGRYTKDKKKVDLSQSQILGTVTVVPNFTSSENWSKFTPSATIEYNFADTLAYLKLARGYKSGGFNYPYTVENPVNPEVLDMYEVGLKSSLFDRNVRITLSGYYYDYKDLQVSRAAAAGSATIITQNAANAKLYGIDGDLNWSPLSGLNVALGFAWQKSEYANYDLATAKVYRATQPGGSGAGMVDIPYAADGERLLRAPAFSGFASVNYEIPVGSSTVPMSLSYSYKGSYKFDFVAQEETEILKQKAYSLLNGRIGYRPPSDNMEVAFWVNNLLDERYYDDVVAAGTGIRGSFGLPRTYGIEASFEF